MFKFKKRETNKKRLERILKLTDGKDYGIFPAPMNAQVAVNELCRYFLGDDWYTSGSISNGQVNTEIVFEIESRYKGKCN